MKGTGIYTVYAHRNKINGKVYVGATQKPLYARFDKGKGYQKCTRFWNDILKYGFDNFDHIVIQTGLTKGQAMILEETLVDTFETMNPEKGYNMRRGGVHNKPCAEVGAAISKAKKGHVVNPETREKLKEYGCKPVLQITMDGVEINCFPSLTAAAAAVKSKKSNIYAVCAGKKPSCRGYKWAYAKRHEERDRVKHSVKR